MDMFEVADRVEQMTEQASIIVRQVMAEFDISHVVAAFSGGDDSIVSTHWAMDYFPDAVVMIGDTQIGIEKTRKHQTACCERFGWKYHRVSPAPEGAPPNWSKYWVDGNTSYEEFVLNHGFPGHAQHHRMYQRLKQRAFRKIKPILGKAKRGSRIMVVSGIRQDESSIRAGYKRAYAEEKSERFVWVNPFYYSSATDFEAYSQEFGLPRNPVKQLCGISGECCCGAHAVPGEREAYRIAEPAFADYLDALEARVMQAFPWGWECGPPKWYIDQNRGQKFLFDVSENQKTFMPAFVGCVRK